MTPQILVLIEKIFEKIREIEMKATNQYKRHQALSKRVKRLEE